MIDPQSGPHPLQGKVAIVTGASGGIGSASARRLAAAGCMVVLGYHSRGAEAERIAAELPGAGHRAVAMPMQDTAALRDMAAMVERAYGRADVLVNCAGFTRMIPHADLEALTDELIDAIFVANVRGPFAMVRALAPLMTRTGEAVIVNISSLSASTGSGSNIAYAGSKAALDTMGMALARVLGPAIRLITISPAAVDTPFVPGRTLATIEKAAAGTPLKRVVVADEVALAVLAAVTHLPVTTGSVLVVDGGRHL